jgi:predicted deacylase
MKRPASQKQTKRKGTPKRGALLAFSARQVSILASLSIALLALICGMGFAIAQSVVLMYLAPANFLARAAPVPTGASTQPAPPPTATDDPIPSATILFPTLTASPTSLPSSTTVEPSTTWDGTPSPVPSLTPYKEVWRTAIGYSVEGRLIEVYRFGNGKRERMIVAGIHGGSEWNTTALAHELIAHLENNPSLIPADISLFILPCLNPDGEARAHSPDGRVNANGVDLNRNWDADWKAAWPRHGCWSLRHTTSGAYPGSEPETQALMGFLLNHNIGALISYHSAALGVLPSGQPPHPESVRLAQAIAAVSPYAYPPVNSDCQYTGTLVDWALQQGTIGVDLELLTHSETDFEINLKVLELLLNW